MKTNRPTISVSNFEAQRLTFKHGNWTYIYDSRGYDSARERDNSFETEFIHRAYDDREDKYFYFWSSVASCGALDGTLIVARSWESAYEIFLDEFAECPFDDDVEEYIMDKVHEYIKEHAQDIGLDLTQQAPKEYFEALADPAKEAYREIAWNRFGDDGVMTVAPNGARTPNGSPYRWSEGINGFELKLIKVEVIV